MIGLIVLSLLLQTIQAAQHSVNVDTIESLRAALNSSKATIAFYSKANVASTSSLFRDISFNYTIVANQTEILNGVKNGTFTAGCVAEYTDAESFNVIKSGIVSGHAAFMLPDNTTEYPHGASTQQSRKHFRNAINLAIVNVQAKNIDFDLSTKFNKPIVDLRTCKLNNPDEFPLPNSNQATGVLKDVLSSRVLLVGSFGDADSDDSDENNEEFPFHSAYLNAIMDEFAKLSGPDKSPYGKVEVKRVYAKSSTANLLRGRVHMTEPYFLIDNLYSGSKESCNSDLDCIQSDTPNGRESCTNSICVAYTRPVTEIFKTTCLAYGTENLFLTKKYPVKSDDANSEYKLSGGAVSALVILSVLLTSAVSAIAFLVWRERIGSPVF